jgi:alkanesulfonate monooxygenase SsuD/methylene tetrahydromethanopterin reductase-like flavin-dependent oxidoreductase (luciferase family)
LLYCGGNGPKALAVGGACMDGILFGGTFQSVVRMGHMAELLQVAEQAAVAAGRPRAMRKVAEIKLSVGEDGRVAREFTKHSVAGRIVSLRESGYDADYGKLGIDPADVDRLQAAEKSGRPVNDYLDLVTNAMVDGIFVAGSPAHCREKMADVCAMARAHGFQQLMFSELGPDLKQGLRLLCDRILPSL